MKKNGRDEVTFSVLTYHASSPEGVGLKHKSKTGLLIRTIDEDVTNPLGGLGEPLVIRATNEGGSPLLLLLLVLGVGVELLLPPASGGRRHRLHRWHLTTNAQNYFTLYSNSVDRYNKYHYHRGIDIIAIVQEIMET